MRLEVDRRMLASGGRFQLGRVCFREGGNKFWGSIPRVMPGFSLATCGNNYALPCPCWQFTGARDPNF